MKGSWMRIWQQVVIVCKKILSQELHEETEENHARLKSQ
jgi:hypothetical protein